MTKERLGEILNAAWRRTDDTDAWDNIIDAMKIAVNETIEEASDLVFEINIMDPITVRLMDEIDDLKITD